MPEAKPDASQIWKQMEDLVVPRLRLGLSERAVYSFLLRHSHLEGTRRLNFSVGWLARGVCLCYVPARNSVRSLASKGALRIIYRGLNGHVADVILPHELRLGRTSQPKPEEFNLEAVDFLHGSEQRNAILQREQSRCFYCLRFLRPRSLVLDHVIPLARRGRNSYCNLVACCVECNARKGEKPAEDLLRLLFREGRLNKTELAARRRTLRMLAEGKLKPALNLEKVHPEQLRLGGRAERVVTGKLKPVLLAPNGSAGNSHPSTLNIQRSTSKPPLSTKPGRPRLHSAA
jgi:hypothetical protein